MIETRLAGAYGGAAQFRVETEGARTVATFVLPILAAGRDTRPS
jgi:hypothetical protein